MPSLRVVSVAVLIGMGAVAAALSGADHGLDSGAEAGATLRGSSLPVVSTAPATATASPAAELDVRAENRIRTGVRSGWRISPTRGTAAGLEAYAEDISVRPGERVPIAVSSQGAVRIRALRIGWYGGAGARQVWSGSVHARPEPADPDAWQARAWADTTGWPEGHYLLRIDQSSAAASRYVPLTVRSAQAAGKILVITSPLSWQAENTGLGASRQLSGRGAAIRTDGPTPSGSPSGSLSGSGPTVEVSPSAANATGAQSRTASFNRPYAAGYGAGGFLAGDAGIVQLAERSGRPLAYATDYDLARDPGLLNGASAVLVGGQSRFWTTSLRNAFRQAGDNGTNLAFFGAGTGSRQVAVAADGRSLKVSTGSASGSVRLTGLRPSCSSGPSGSAGEGSVMSVAAGWTISDATWWGYHGTGLGTGEVVPGLVAGGVDRADTSSPSGGAGGSPPVQVLSFSRISCGPEGSGRPPDVQSAVYLVRDSEAGVFTAGVGRWSCAILGTCVDQAGAGVDVDRRTQRFVVRVTRTVIEGFAQARAGRRHPARNSAAQYAALR